MPTPLWPDGAHCVVAITIDFDGLGNEIGEGNDPVGIRSAGGLSSRRGVPEFLRVLDRHDVLATFFVPGYDAETCSDVIAAIVTAGHEVAAHGYLHEEEALEADAEEVLLRKSHEILTRVAGSPPVGWRSPGGRKNDRTLAVLSELGYVYDSSDKDHDLPYPAIVATRRSREMIEIPNQTTILNDNAAYVGGALAPSEVLELWKHEFEALYEDVGFFHLTLHPRSGFGSGTPARVLVVDHLISYMKAFEGVSFMRMREIAEWCSNPANGHLGVEGPWIGGGRP